MERCVTKTGKISEWNFLALSPEVPCNEIDDDIQSDKTKNSIAIINNLNQIEDFTANVQREAGKLSEFYEIPKSVEIFLDTHTNSERKR